MSVQSRIPSFLRKTLAAVALAGVAQAPAHAGLMLTVKSLTTDELWLQISGTFDADTIGESKGYLAVKNKWSSNVGVHTEMFAFAPAVTLNTITIGGSAVTTAVQDALATWTDNIFFINPQGSERSILAGTAVGGEIRLSGAGAFNPANLSLELVSGLNRPIGRDDWARLEAVAEASSGQLPEPGALALVSMALLSGFVSARRRQR